MADWPPAGAGERVLYPQPDRRLADTAPNAEAGTSTFRYDPADPTPTVGGRLLSRQAGYRDDSALAERPDVLSFTGEPLGEEILVAGRPVVELDHSCDNPHFDVFARISEVDAGGVSRNVSDGFRRFRGVTDEPLRIELDPIAHRFAAGSRIRLLIAGGSHPRFARNLGTGEADISGRRMVASTHTLRHGPSSRVVLPVTDAVG